MDVVLWKHRIKQCGGHLWKPSGNLFFFFFIELKKRYAFNIMYFYKRPVTPMGDSLLLIYTGSHSRLNPFNFRVLRLYCNKNTRINFIIIIIIINPKYFQFKHRRYRL